jgi:hypothetical protein
MAAHNSDLEARVRAARYPIEVPLTYQAAPDGDWLEGRSMNVSDESVVVVAIALGVSRKSTPGRGSPPGP